MGQDSGPIHIVRPNRGGVRMSEKLSAEQETIAAFGAAMITALKLLVVTLQDNGALEHGQYTERLRLFAETTKDKTDDSVLAILHDLRLWLLD
jgi:hypothetical protein